MKKSLWITAAVMAVGIGISAQADWTNAAFGTWSFDDLSSPTDLKTYTGPLQYGSWAGGETLVVTNVNHSYVTFNSSIPGERALTNALFFDGTVTNLMTNLNGRVVVDFLLLPTRRDDAPAESSFEGAQLGFFFNSEGKFVLISGAESFTVSTNDVVYASNEWVRVTIDQDYTLDYPMFQIAINGTKMSHANGFTLPGFESPGTWFPVFVQKNGVNELVGSGVGMLDDVVFKTWVKQTTEWLTNYAFASTNYGGNVEAMEADDYDHDGVNNLNEVIAGTNPENINSVLQIEDIQVETDGDVVVTFTGSVEGTAGNYQLQSSTNLVNYLTVTNVVKGVGEKVITITPPAGSVKGFYKVVVPYTE